MLRTRVKICGITQINDALTVVNQGADAIGLVFYAPSPRAVTIAQAKEIVKIVPAFVSVVGLFVNATADEIQKTIAEVGIDLIQFHGDERADFCGQFNRPFIKAIRVQRDTNLVQYAHDFKCAKALLLDTYTEGLPGGTGHTFDWHFIPENFPLPIILAGGLTAQNVQQAITQVKPYAVDVSGGVELTKGIKDAEKIAAFMQQVWLS